MPSVVDKAISNLSVSKEIQEISQKLDNLFLQVEQLSQHVKTGFVKNNPSFNPAAELGFTGENANKVYRGFVGAVAPLSHSPAPIPFASSLCQQVHFSLDQYRFWMRAMKMIPRYHRKLWEFAYIAQVLHERGFLASGRRGLGFGVGLEPLPALFASFGVQAVASDQSLEGAVRAGWADTSQHSTDLSKLNANGICTDHMFRSLVSFEEVDMNAIDAKFDGQFDFCWSSCSLEHLGSLQHGIDFIKNSIKVLKPGGLAVHTTEFNLTSNDATIESEQLSVYRRKDIDRLFEELSAQGHKPVEIDYRMGDGYADTVVDLPPYGCGEPHLRLRLGEFDCTSIGMIVERGA